jgi:hypothetical protein
MSNETLNETCENTVISSDENKSSHDDNKLSPLTKRMRIKREVVAKEIYIPATLERFVHEYLSCFRYLQARVAAGYMLTQLDNESKMLNSHRFRDEVAKQAKELRLRVLSGVAREMKGTASMQAVELLEKAIDKQFGSEDKKDKKDGPRRGWGPPPPTK